MGDKPISFRDADGNFVSAMGDKPISFRDADGNFVSAADVWNEKKLEELFNRLNPNRALRLARTKKENPSQ
ncbi:TPA: hypothetical protein VZZ95_001682 [Streptococcus pneumoniae]|nr:hypothetical protein [Streptococcus pneumoniae]HEW9526346.1 hypothetical protein [Streptococcus pneumoniae]